MLSAWLFLTGVSCFAGSFFPVSLSAAAADAAPSLHVSFILRKSFRGFCQKNVFAFNQTIYAAEILGEINHYYVLIPGWDTILHTLNGFLCATLGFSMVYLMNRNSKNINLSPFYLTLMAFCFSMTVGVIWEFIEFNADCFLLLDMQKDHVISRFGSVSLDPQGLGSPVAVKNITETVIKTATGEVYRIEGGYLDIGLEDTMKDLLVNFLGAAVFSIIGYTALKSGRCSTITDKFLLRPVSGQEQKEEEEILRRKRMRLEKRRRKKRKKKEDPGELL